MKKKLMLKKTTVATLGNPQLGAAGGGPVYSDPAQNTCGQGCSGNCPTAGICRPATLEWYCLSY